MGSSLSNLTPNNDTNLHSEQMRIIDEIVHGMQDYERDLQRLESEREEINTEYLKIEQETDELSIRLRSTKSKLTNKKDEIERLKEKRNRFDMFCNPILEAAKSGSLPKDSDGLAILKQVLQGIGINITGSRKTEETNILDDTYIANNDNKAKGGNDNV